MFKILMLCFLLMTGVSLQAQDEAEIHKELRSLVNGIEDSINSQNYSDLKKFFDKDFMATPINQEVITTYDGIDKYFNSWFGKGKYLASLKIKLEPDELTKLYNNNTFGIVKGSGDESYILTDGRTFDIKTRWTATVIKEKDGSWKILTLHLGTNFLDNPILSVAEKSAKYTGLAGIVFGLIIGLLIGYFWRRKSISK